MQSLRCRDPRRVTTPGHLADRQGLLSSKASGEPPVLLAASVVTALRMAAGAARRDAGQPGFFPLDSPATVERLLEACSTDPSQFLVAL